MSSTNASESEPNIPQKKYVPQKYEPYRWPLSEYRKLEGVDLFHDMRTVLIDGVIYKKPTFTPLACYCTGMIDDWLRSIPLPGHSAWTAVELEIDEWNRLVPRHAVLKGAIRDYANAHPTTAAWVIEISEASLAFDTSILAELYAKAKVPDYWVLDIVNRRMIVFREPDPNPTGMGVTAYRTHMTFQESDTVKPLISTDIKIVVCDLLP